MEATSRGTICDEKRTKWNEFAQTGVSKYVTVHRRGGGHSFEGTVIVGLAKPSREKVVEERVPSGGMRGECPKLAVRRRRRV